MGPYLLFSKHMDVQHGIFPRFTLQQGNKKDVTASRSRCIVKISLLLDSTGSGHYKQRFNSLLYIKFHQQVGLKLIASATSRIGEPEQPNITCMHIRSYMNAALVFTAAILPEFYAYSNQQSAGT